VKYYLLLNFQRLSRFSILIFKGSIVDNTISVCNFISFISILSFTLNTNVRIKVARITFIEIIAYLVPTSLLITSAEWKSIFFVLLSYLFMLTYAISWSITKRRIVIRIILYIFWEKSIRIKF